MPARAVALRALRAWRGKKQFADAIISELSERERVHERERAFARELFYGVLRNLRLLDFWISRLRNEKLDDDARDLLRLGLYQLFLLRTAKHAAVNETVAIAHKKQRSLINAVLRTAQRREDELNRDAAAQPIGVRFSHPDFILQRWQKNFGETPAMLLAQRNNRSAPIYARINRLKIEPREFFAAYPELRSLPGYSDFVELSEIPTTALSAGQFYVQDPSTILACELLDPRPNERVLDACAAPGGKTALLAQLMSNRGSILACDRDPERLARLRENMQRLGVEIAQVLQQDWTKAPTTPMESFDRILIDAPCSNTGVMRRRVDVRWRLQPDDFARMQKRQLTIARQVVPLLKARGTLVYSTCSLEPEENGHVVEKLLNEFAELHLTQQQFSTPFAGGFDGAFAAKFVRVR